MLSTKLVYPYRQDYMNSIIAIIQDINALIETIYQLQIGDDRGVYPYADAQLMEHIATLPAAVNDQFCCMKKWENSSIQSVPYVTMYREEFDAIDRLLDQLLADSELPSYLRDFVQAIKRTLGDNDRLRLEWVWLDIFSQPTIDYIWNFGPIETRSDHIHGKKRFFTSVFAQVDQSLVDFVSSVHDHIVPFHASLSVAGSYRPTRVTSVLSHIVDWSGEVKRLNATWWSRPENPQLAAEHGSIKQVFLNNLKRKTDTMSIPLSSIVYTDEWHQHVSSFLERRYFLHVLLHEICHTIGKYPGYIERAWAAYSTFEEIRTDLISVMFSYYLEHKGVLAKGVSDSYVQYLMITNLHNIHIFNSSWYRKDYSYTFDLSFDALSSCLQPSDDKLAWTSNGNYEKLLEPITVKLLELAKEWWSHDFSSFISTITRHPWTSSMIPLLQSHKIPF